MCRTAARWFGPSGFQGAGVADGGEVVKDEGGSDIFWWRFGCPLRIRAETPPTPPPFSTSSPPTSPQRNDVTHRGAKLRSENAGVPNYSNIGVLTVTGRPDGRLDARQLFRGEVQLVWHHSIPKKAVVELLMLGVISRDAPRLDQLPRRSDCLSPMSKKRLAKYNVESQPVAGIKYMAVA